MMKQIFVVCFALMTLKPGFSQSPAFFVASNENSTSLIDGADFSKLAEFAAPAVVDIETQAQNNVFLSDPFFQPFFGGMDLFAGRQVRGVVKSSGSAVLISPDGMLLSCAHVVDGAEKIVVHLADGRSYDAKVLAVYSDVDLAFLKIDGADKLPYLKIGSSKHVKNGMPVAALGNSFNLGQNFTNGIVSAHKRRFRISQDAPSPVVIQHNAAVNPGNSGGALVDRFGNLIGINNAIYSKGGGSNGVGFAIPSDLIVLYLQKFVSKTKSVQLGIVDLETLTQSQVQEEAKGLQLKPTCGVKVLEVANGTPMQKAGVVKGDIILAIDEFDIDAASDYNFIESTLIPGQGIKLKLIRKGELLTVDVVPEVLNEVLVQGKFEMKDVPYLKGVKFQVLTQEIKKRYKLKPKAKGLLVEVEGQAEADKSQTLNPFAFGMMTESSQVFQTGDILLKVADMPVFDQNSLKKAIAVVEKNRRLSLTLLRGTMTLTVNITLSHSTSGGGEASV